MAIDGQSKFLFVLNPASDDISMFQIDQATGALSEVLGSPFAVPTIDLSPPSQPISIATERSGQFVFVGYLLADSGNSTGPSAVASLAIDTSGSSPVLRLVASILPQDSPIRLLTDSKGLRLYVGLGIGNDGTMQSGPEVYSIDGAGNLSFQGLAPNPENRGTDFAIDPQDRFIFALGGLMAAHLVTCPISPVDGTLLSCSSPLDLTSAFPGMVVESSGHFLYIPDSLQSVVVFSVDQTTGNATQSASLPGIVLSKGGSVADPAGPYIYSADSSTTAGGVHAYLVNQQTGNLTEILGSPFSAGVSVCCQGLAITGNPVQAVSGPAAAIFPSTASNFTATAGFSSAPQTFSLVNTGNQLLTISSISLAGTDASSFSQANTCAAALSPNAHCSITVTFNPATAGLFTANLQIADNAPGSPQTLVLNGTGVAPAPAVTFSPSAESFPATNQGSSAAPQSLTVTSSGNTTLHISSVSLAGPNASDFSFTNNCTAPLAPGANCSIALVFTPTAPGQRTADLMIADDAQGSPQTVVLNGTGIAVLPALSLSPPAPSFPATTQGGSSPPQTLTAVNSGNAPLQVSSISIAGSSASEFSVSNTCTAPLAPAASCSISLVFSPTASGQGNANLTISDDAPNSPQTILLNATANPAFSVAAAPGSSTAATISAGQPAQFQLQLTPGAGFTGTVSLACSGAPLGAVCQVPASVSLAIGAATFNVNVTTSGPALLPPSAPLRFPPGAPVTQVPLFAPIVLVLLFFLFAISGKNRPAFQLTLGKNRLALLGLLSAAIFCITFATFGCGGGSASVTTPPPPIVTPSGTSTLTISLSATSSSGQPLQLQPIQLTLTVK